MKILIIVPLLPPAGGAEQVAWKLAKELAKSNETHLLTFSDKEHTIEKKNVMIHFLPKTKHVLRYYSTFGKKKVRTIVDKIRPDVINAHGDSILAYTLKKSKFKTVLTLHNSEFFHYNKTVFDKIRHNLFYKRPVRKYDLVTTTSKQMQKYFARYFQRKIHLIPNGVDINIFKPIGNIKRENKMILHIGRLIKNKRVKIIFELAKSLPDYKFIIIGNGELKNYVTLPNLKFKGRVSIDELVSYYNKANYSIFPSMIENFPLVGLEAMACGSIVISSTTGFSEYIDDKVNGFTFNKPDIENIMNVIKKPYSRNKIRNSAIVKAKTFSWQEIIPKYISLYRD